MQRALLHEHVQGCFFAVDLIREMAALDRKMTNSDVFRFLKNIQFKHQIIKVSPIFNFLRLSIFIGSRLTAFVNNKIEKNTINNPASLI